MHSSKRTGFGFDIARSWVVPLRNGRLVFTLHAHVDFESHKKKKSQVIAAFLVGKHFVSDCCVILIFASTAAAVAHELRREVSSGRAAVLETAPRLVNLHHQHRPESSGSRLRGRRMQVHPIQLFSHRHEARLDADAPWKTDALSRGTASDLGHALHYDLLRGPVIEHSYESALR